MSSKSSKRRSSKSAPKSASAAAAAAAPEADPQPTAADDSGSSGSESPVASAHSSSGSSRAAASGPSALERHLPKIAFVLLVAVVTAVAAYKSPTAAIVVLTTVFAAGLVYNPPLVASVASLIFNTVWGWIHHFFYGFSRDAYLAVKRAVMRRVRPGKGLPLRAAEMWFNGCEVISQQLAQAEREMGVQTGSIVVCLGLFLVWYLFKIAMRAFASHAAAADETV